MINEKRTYLNADKIHRDAKIDINETLKPTISNILV